MQYRVDTFLARWWLAFGVLPRNPVGMSRYVVP